MNKKHTTTRTTASGEKVRVYIDKSGKVFITVISKDGYTIKNDICMEV